MGSYCLHPNRFSQFSSQLNWIMQGKTKNLFTETKKNWISHAINFPDAIRQHNTIHIASSKINDVDIPIYIEHYLYTGICLQSLWWVCFRLKKISPPFHCFPILSAYSQDEILIKIILCHLVYVFFPLNFEILLASKHLKKVMT